MKKTSYLLSGLLTLTLSLAFSASAWAVATNDNFASAATITGATAQVTGNDTGATLESGEPRPFGASQTLWWTWTAPKDGFVTLNTIGTAFNNSLAVYQGSSVSALIYVTNQNDNLSANQSQVTFPVKSGQVFKIQVGSGDGNSGAVVVNLSMATLASGGITSATVYGAPTTFSDNFSNRLSVTGSAFTAIGFNESAGLETGEPRPTSVSQTLWWTWTAPKDGIATFDTIGTNFNNTLAAYQGTAITALTYVDNETDNLGAAQSQVSFPVKSGQVYQIQVGGQDASGTVVLNLKMTTFASVGITAATVYGAPAVYNDNFSSRLSVGGTAFTAIGFNESASLETGETRPGSVSQTLWWTWTAPKDGFVTIDTIGTNFSNIIAVYQGTTLTTLNSVSAGGGNLGTNESQAAFPTKAGQTYQIQVGGADASGTVIFNLQMTSFASAGILNSAVYGAPIPFNDNFSSRLTVSGTTFTAIGFNASATLETSEPRPASVSQTLWWSWTAPYTGNVTMDTVGTTFDNDLAVYQGPFVTQLTTIASARGNLGANQSQVQFSAVAGQVYQIQVGGENAQGRVILNVNPQVNVLDNSLYFQNGTLLGSLALNTTFLPSSWQGIGAMAAGWQERAISDINGDGVPDILFQNGTSIAALILDASGNPASWVGIGAMNAGWELRGAANIQGNGQLDLIFQNGTSLGFLAVNTSGVPVSWNGIGAVSSGWQLRAVADLNADGHDELLFQNGTSLAALQVSTSGLPTAWKGIGTMSAGWTLSDAVDLNADGQPDLIFQNGTALGALEVNTSFAPTAWHGIGGIGAGWTLPGDY